VKCPHCGKNNNITINGKTFCADCGEETINAKPHKHASAKTKTKPATKAHKPVHHAVVAKPVAHPSSRHLLDLSQKAAKKARPSQTIHGVRKDPAAAKVAASTISKGAHHRPATKVIPRPAHSRSQTHVLKAKEIKRSEKITKFSPDTFSHYQASKRHTEKYQPKPATQMAPHESYKISEAALASTSETEQRQHTPPKPRPGRKGLLAKLADTLRARPRFAMVATVASCFLLLAGYITYLNYPNLALRVAASRAGVNASLPSYTPSGYSFSGPVNYSPGQVTVRFGSHSDSTDIVLTQRQTQWDSASLLENAVAPKTKDYLTFQQSGITIYVYEGNKAAWVNSGIWYTLEGSHHLSSDQIVKVATSI